MKSLLLYVIRLFAHASFGIPTDLSSFSSPPTPSIPHILSPTNIPPSHSLAYLILKTLHNNISSETLKDTSAHVVRSLCILQRRQIVKRKGTIKRMKIKRMKIQLLFRWLWMCFKLLSTLTSTLAIQNLQMETLTLVEHSLCSSICLNMK